MDDISHNHVFFLHSFLFFSGSCGETLIKSPSSVVYASVHLERKQCDYPAAKDAVKHLIQVHVFEHWSPVVAVFWEVLELSGGWVWVKEVVTE